MRTRPLLHLGALGLLFLAGAAGAQNLYRSVDAHGRVTYSDRPPAAGSAPPSSSTGAAGHGAAGAAAAAATGALPYALRQTVQRYPVTLYTKNDCEPCAAGRTLLQTRGIPFEERTVGTPQDAAALERLSGQNALPLLTVGSQQLKGFSDGEWSRYLDAAGYAPSIQLPAGYRNPPAQPLVAVSPAVPAASAAPAPPAARTLSAPPPPPPGTPTPDNPAGIRF
ncbi:glutaredoxin domain-containing protein [Xenophilus sp. Marseille-Q4582]|uniref:glutaredoxin domain-containing protein n=1 Tax=Xenophilus sp. Marseille-Q4582 TaxID=2866600 RepID=UPI001CE4977E|nr:glutaredoxin domain-containing protein [Xenophilus sp. Marseille-Q4582]